MNDPVRKDERWHHGCCYCSLWATSPETLHKQGIPGGYCGKCMVCGKSGHTMHFPGAAPFTGSWCKFHYYRTMILHPTGTIGVFLWMAAAVGAIVTLAIKLRH